MKSAEVLEVLNLLLEMEGAQVSAFSDIGMPKMNGHELMQKLRTIAHLRQVPTIPLTGYSAGSDQKKVAESGFSTHLSKPVAHDSLIDLIEKLCRLRR